MHRIRRQAAMLVVGAILLAACSSSISSETPGTPTPTPVASIMSAAEPTPEPTAPSTPEPTATATPNPDDVPVYAAGAMLETHIGGLRVRARPGVDERVVTGLLPEGANLLAILGPVLVDGYGWYLVSDSDANDPEFTEGWVAAGFDPDPFLVPTVFDLPDNPYVAGFAHDANGEYGPVRLTDANYSIRWIAAPPTRDGCAFAVDLRRGSDAPVTAIRATIGAAVAPGMLYSDFFIDHPELTGDIFVTVTSNCRWALTFVQIVG